MLISVPLQRGIQKFRAKGFLLLFLFLFPLAGGAYAQSQKVSLTRQQTTLKAAFEEIEKQTGLNVAYNEKVIDPEGKISVNLKDRRLSDVLSAILAGTDASFVIRGNRIIITNPVPPSVAPRPRRYHGTVTEDSGEPIAGARLTAEGMRAGAVTDNEGRFAITLVPGTELTVSCDGYEPLRIKTGEDAELTIVLAPEARSIDEVVVVGYGTQRKGNLTGSVASVSSDKLTVAPVASITNTLAGQLPGLGAKQTSGTPGSDDAYLWIRGYSGPLVIVDGAESSMNYLDPSQIESISILKDASASIYGARAGNGVILVTTKRGVMSRPVVTLHSSVTMQGSTNIFPATSSWQRAQAKREQHINAGLPSSLAPYTEEEIQKFKDGTDPNYGNYSWFDATIRTWAPQQNHNVSVRGGSENIKYYGYLGYNNQQTIFRHDGGSYTRFNLQSNIDANITSRLKVSVDISMTSRKEYFPAGDGINHYNLWEAVYQSDPSYATSLPDPGRLAYANVPISPIYMTSTEYAGYTDTRNTHLRSSGSVVYDFGFVPGLTAKAMIYSNFYIGTLKSFLKQQDFYIYDFENDRYTLAGSSTNPTNLRQQSNSENDLTQQYSLSYNRTFNEVHSISALAVFEGITYSNNGFSTQRSGFSSTAVEQFNAGDPSTASNDSWSSEMGRISWIGRLNYSYRNRYLLETIFRADASARFHKDNRWGYFPSVSVGWVMSEEEFMKPLEFLNYLKIRLSAGKAGYDNIGDFNYLSTYGFDGGYIIGDRIITGIFPTRMANIAFTWETMSTYNAGIDFALFRRRLYGTVEAFYRLRKGILGTRNASLPSTFGAELAIENLNSEDTRGFELVLGSAGNAGKFRYDVSGNISWSRSKHVSLDEPVYADDDQKRIYGRSGRWTDLRYGYVSDGLFTSMEEIENLPFIYADLNGNSTLRPGDIKYKDLNGDNKLDWRDQTIIGKGSLPQWMYGITGNFQYYGFDLNVLFQGAFGYSTYVYLDPVFTEYGFEKRWTAETNDPNAIVPRLGSNGYNNVLSDYYLHDTFYFRLKSAAFGYSIPRRALQKTGIENCRVYVAGTNIFTLSTLHRYGVNPEQSDGNPNTFYPIQRTVSFGLDITF